MIDASCQKQLTTKPQVVLAGMQALLARMFGIDWAVLGKPRAWCICKALCMHLSKPFHFNMLHKRKISPPEWSRFKQRCSGAAKNPWYLQIQQTLPQVLQRPLYLALKAFDEDKARAVFQQNRPLWQSCAWNIEPLRPFLIIFWKPPWCVSEKLFCRTWGNFYMTVVTRQIAAFLDWIRQRTIVRRARRLDAAKKKNCTILTSCCTLLPLKCLFKLKVWKTWADRLTDLWDLL